MDVTTEQTTTRDEGRGLRSTASGVIAPILVGLGLAVSIIVFLQALSVLTTWSTEYGQQAVFTVERCETTKRLIFSSVECEGSLNPVDGGEPRPSTLRGAPSAFGSTIPSAGATVPAYHRLGEASASYPWDGRSTEFARAVMAVVPRLFLVVGTAAWLAGWLLTHAINAQEAERSPFRFRFPHRFLLKPSGVRWVVVGLIWLAIDLFVVDDLLGTVGVG